MVKVYINDVDTKAPSSGHIVDGRALSGCVLPDISVEYFSHENTKFYKSESVNPLIAALHYSFTNHFPVQITPDVIFNTILHSISAHTRNNPAIPNKSIKSTNSLIKIEEFANLREHIVDQVYQEQYHYLFSPEIFLTSDNSAAIANACAFLDPVEHYCDYELVTYCGIPYLDIKGSKQDWIHLSKTTQTLISEMHLPPQYNDQVQQLILQFIRVFDGDIDQEHWNNIYLYTGPNASGQQAGMNGWISRFFLYIKDSINPFYATAIANQRKNESWFFADLISLFDFPLGISNIEIHHEEKYKTLTAGLIGVAITQEGHLKPELGWMIHSCRNDSQVNKQERRQNGILRFIRFIWKRFIS